MANDVEVVASTVRAGTIGARGASPRARELGWRAAAEGLGGAVRMAGALLTPFDRSRRCRWGLGPAAERSYPGDDLVPTPSWQWTHGIEIDAPTTAVWPWVAQVGADRGGFYSYAWLEDLVGCGVRNADAVEPTWQLCEGDGLVLHPKSPPVPVVEVEPGRWLVAHAAPHADDVASGKPWASVSWLFYLEDLPGGRCRFVSRFRTANSGHVLMRAAFGPALVEPIGFAMDRRMLLGVKQRAERATRSHEASPGRPVTARPGQRAAGAAVPAGLACAAVPTGLTRAVRRDWRALAAPTPEPDSFDPADVEQLPAPVARWLRHAISPGTALPRAALLAMHGEIRLSRWQPFSALQVLAPPSGYVWSATAGSGVGRVRGFDRYTRGNGEMRWRLGGLVPVMSARGADVTRSAAGRLAGETMLLPPAALDPGIVWHAGDERRATAAVALGGLTHRVDVEIDDDGALRRVSLPRWGNPDGEGYADHLFTVTFEGEVAVATDGGGRLILPRSFEAGWSAGPGVFFRATLDGVRWC